ncbi:major facilitator superfamily domain-containing protein [Fusarium flagelliforme]|uniref:major facilitator superfamily domain-containing protein n=1 Tax=Fusarium flagelliforme TaxID=2675880 RepID=UPI001E8D6AF7|nr:major facilitator superfamily domain-containing protein [Fusarium flagelliforme]KAH7179484.1 major facilitator superfamily domain-containing protein [Fusarium flagelliforme]
MAASQGRDTTTKLVDVKDQSHVDSGNESAASSIEHPFSDPEIADRWRKVYEKAEYENRHRFDPSFTWTDQEEKKLVRRIDFRICLWAWVMFLSLDFHRRNINRAISDNMLPEIGMNTNDFNYGQTIFLVCFLSAELPSGLISKKLGADRWIPFLICSWSLVAGSQAALQSRSAYFAIKALLGLLMGGFIPDIVLWLTYFYKSNELPIRLAFFWTALSTSNIVGSLLAAGILQMRGVLGWGGWRWLFLLEAIGTFIVGLFSWVLMPPGPCQTKSWFRGKDGWFNEREEYIMVNRLLRDDPSKGDMNNREAVNLSKLWKAVKDWEQWPLYLLGLMIYIPPSPFQTYLSFILRQIGFSVFQANLLAIPSQFLFAVNLLIVTWVSGRVKERGILSSLSNIWIFPWVLALVVLPGDISPWVRYALITGLLSYPYCHAILVGWNAKNSNSVRTRAISAALYNMTVQSGNIAASNIFREDDQPLYRRGNRVILGITSANIILFYLVKYFYIWRNQVRDRNWNALTKEQQQDYLLNTTDEGQQRLDFRFVH